MLDGKSKTGSELTNEQVDQVLEVQSKGKGKKAGKTVEERVTIPSLKIGQATLTIVGETELCTNRFPEKSIQQILDTHMKKPKQGREAKVPENDFLGSLYVIDGKEPKLQKKGERTYAVGATFGIPGNALKLASVAACRQDLGIPMTKARGTFHVVGYYLPILDAKTGKPAVPYMRQDVVRLPNGAPDIRFRGSFENWKIEVPVEFNTRVITLEEIANLLNTAGFSVGLSEWRPEKGGSFGRFRVA
jgi:hypothetical protein